MERLWSEAQGWSPEAWAAGGTWATVVIAGTAAVFAFFQVREARRLREAQVQPFVVVGLEQSKLDSQHLLLTIENIGQTLARDVTVNFEPPIRSKLQEKEPGHYSIDYAWLASEGIPSMPPGMRIERVLDNAMLWEADEMLEEVASDVLVRFKDHTGKSQDPLHYRVDCRAFLTGAFIEARTVHDLVPVMKDIRSEVKKWTEPGTMGLRVWRREGADRDEHLRNQVAELEAQRERFRRQAEEADSGGAEAD